MRWSVGPVGVKDLFTLVNLMGGVAAVRFVTQGRTEMAGIALLAGYLLGDTLDGVVARATRTANRFGAELDTATDHFVQGIVPAIIVFAVYEQGGHGTAGFVLLAVLITSATVRQALFTVARLDDPLIWCGLPRTVSGYASMSFVLSTLFFRESGIGYTAGLVLIPFLALLALLPIPYMTHRGARRMQTWARALVIGFLLTPVITLAVARRFTFDVMFFWLFGYALLGWLPLSREERRSFRVRYRQWAAEISR